LRAVPGTSGYEKARFLTVVSGLSEYEKFRFLGAGKNNVGAFALACETVTWVELVVVDEL
jgi:hypothetical protein